MGEWESHHTAVTSPDLPKKSRRPASVAEAVERIRKFVVQLFMRDDGEGVDWSSPMIAAALFRLAFYAIDRMPRRSTSL